MIIDMIQNESYIDFILEAIITEARIYLEDHEGLNLIETKTWRENPLIQRIALIDFEGVIKITILICIEEQLFQVIFNHYFESVSPNEIEELEDALPDEIINMIVGLSIRNFPKELDSLKLSVPYKLSSENLKPIFLFGKHKTKTLTTEYGNISFSILDFWEEG